MTNEFHECPFLIISWNSLLENNLIKINYMLVLHGIMLPCLLNSMLLSYWKIIFRYQTEIGFFPSIVDNFLCCWNWVKFNAAKLSHQSFDRDRPFCRNDLKPALLKTEDVLISYSKSKKLPDFLIYRSLCCYVREHNKILLVLQEQFVSSHQKFLYKNK